MDTKKTLAFAEQLCKQIDEAEDRVVLLNEASRQSQAFAHFYANVHKLGSIEPEHWVQSYGFGPALDRYRIEYEEKNAQVERVDELSEQVKTLNEKHDKMLEMLENLQPKPRKPRKAKATEPVEPAAEPTAEADADASDDNESE